MFLSTSVLNNLMKKAYKTGLVVARTQDAQENDWLYLAGSYWEVSVNKDFIPKTLGDIITLIGELPRPGERFKATKEGNQIEIEMPMAINEEGFGTDTLTITDVLLIGTQEPFKGSCRMSRPARSIRSTTCLFRLSIMQW